MDRDSWSFIQDILIEAVELQATDQEAFVRKKLSDRPDLIDEVLSLLRAPLEIPSEVKHHPIYSLISSSEIEPGRRVKQYKVEEALGKGGMGVVYKAWDTKLDRHVALKFLPSHLCQDKRAKQRFELEAKSASSLNHANICTIYDIDELDDGQMFIAMAYYDGETLKEKVRQGPLAEELALDIMIQTAKGLHKAHQSDIIHRDIKPGNLMVTRDGEVKILDFGIVKVADLSLTVVGHIIGTASYMSPERFKKLPVDHRADIWSLGAVFYEALVGYKLFDGDYDESVMYQIQFVEPDFSPLKNGTPGITQVIKKCLAKKPGDRYSSAKEVAEALEEIKRGAHWLGNVPRVRPEVWKTAGVLSLVLLFVVGVFTLNKNEVFSPLWSLLDREQHVESTASNNQRPPSEVAANLPEEVRVLLYTQNVEELETFINKYYIEQVFRFADSPEGLESPGSCYILFYDDNGIVALLGPEENGARVDFIEEEWVEAPYMDKYSTAVKLAFQ